ncbi:peptide chain release factor N(5)-glutamine methyltransferase [Paludifilum halophilum]|uniref:Release factor glutamine methyltransferase n=1 Tax=Paludifilum halophilum TaxID=1642702 RepID=A0A235B6S8_9BACL|nr:peptide chain release factor N(5)-glutamine methyltransferase [Paludifilum halophilum]OYD07996.1 protein-(glutamine-N5) methyltransferase, release factor-specific [Paludifilum halophilum]
MDTVGEAYRWASSFLDKNGVESSLFEAELLLRTALGWDRTRFFTEWDAPLNRETFQRFREWVERRKQGVPLQYLTGEQEFYGRTFRVNPSVLIPRPDTEVLVEAALKTMDQKGPTGRAVDIGTGSGALAVTLAAEKPDWEWWALDRSSEALALARANAEFHGMEEKIRWLQGDWLTPLMEREMMVDVIVSNPPYIPSADIDGLERQVKDYEPRLALDGGEDGLDPYRRILEQVPDVLKCPGWIALEVGEGQGAAVARLLHRLPGEVQTSVIPDLAGRDRVVTGRVDDSPLTFGSAAIPHGGG